MKEVLAGSPCPQCGSSLGDEFGMITCVSCGANLFVTSELQAQIEEPVAPGFVSNPTSEKSNDPDLAVLLEPFGPNESMNDLEPFQSPEGASVSFLDQSGEPIASEPMANDPTAPSTSIAQEDEFNPADPLGLTEFSEQPESSGLSGPLIYDVKISGIDSAEQRQQLFDVLSDPKFGWSSDELRSQVRRGELELQGLNPAKAAVLVKKVLTTSLEIRWTSRWMALSQSALVFLVSLSLLTLVLFSSLPLYAQGAGSEPTCKWSEHEAKMLASQTKARSLQDELAGLIASKKKATSLDDVKVITTQIQYKYEDLRKTIAQYEEERTHSRFAHPERALPAERSYPAQKLMSLDEIESAFGLDGRLDRIRAQVRTVYPAKGSAERSSAEQKRQPASHSEKAPSALDDLTGLKLIK